MSPHLGRSRPRAASGDRGDTAVPTNRPHKRSRTRRCDHHRPTAAKLQSSGTLNESNTPCRRRVTSTPSTAATFRNALPNQVGRTPCCHRQRACPSDRRTTRPSRKRREGSRRCHHRRRTLHESEPGSVSRRSRGNLEAPAAPPPRRRALALPRLGDAFGADSGRMTLVLLEAPLTTIILPQRLLSRSPTLRRETCRDTSIRSREPRHLYIAQDRRPPRTRSDGKRSATRSNLRGCGP